MEIPPTTSFKKCAQDSGRYPAIIYSIVVSCRVHGKDPLAYLRDVLTRLPKMTNQDDLTPLLPRNWQPA